MDWKYIAVFLLGAFVGGFMKGFIVDFRRKWREERERYNLLKRAVKASHDKGSKDDDIGRGDTSPVL